MLPAYLADDPTAGTLRGRLRAALLELEPYGEHADFGDPSFMGSYALNMLDAANWVEVEGGRAYQSPNDEADHLKRLSARNAGVIRNSEMEARIQLAIDGSQHATPGTARDAIEYAAGDLPDDTDTDALQSRSTRLIATAMLVARDGDDALLGTHETWVREVIGRALLDQSDHHPGAGSILRFNRPALGALALAHLWLRGGSNTDRDALIAIAVRRDLAGLPAFTAARERIVEKDPRLLKAAMRAAFSGVLWRWHPRNEDEAAQRRFEAERTTVSERAIAAEVAWLDGADEPAWPAFPRERPFLRHQTRMRVSGPTAFDDKDDATGSITHGEATVHVNSQAAARWLRLLNGSDLGNLDWHGEVVEAYSDWTATMNGLGLSAKAEVDRPPSDWNEQFYVLFAATLIDASPERFDVQLKLITGLPDQSFSNVAETLIHAADVLYFNDPSRPSARPVELRRQISNRTLSLSRWKFNGSPGDSSVDYETGGVIAKLLLNTHNPFRGTRSYLVPAVTNRLDPLLASMRPLLSGGPTTFVALCTMNMLLVAPRARHLDFLLAAVEAWFERLPTHAGIWITMGIGRKIVEWFEAAISEDAGILGPRHPRRERIDRILGQLVGVGVAEAHQLEKHVEQGTMTDTHTAS